MANLTCNEQALMNMIFRSSFLAWLEIQVQQQQNNDEQLQWAKVLINIVLTADHHKLDSISRGSWRNSVYRCLSMLLSRRKSCLVWSLILKLIVAVSKWVQDFVHCRHCHVQAGPVVRYVQSHCRRMCPAGDSGSKNSRNSVGYKRGARD